MTKDRIGFIKCSLNSLAGDSITVGMTYVNEEGEVYIWLSNNQMNKLKKILKKNVFSLLKFHLDSLKRAFEGGEYNLESLNWSIIHQNGLVRYTEPSTISTSSWPTKKEKVDAMEMLFNKRIDNEE